MTAVSSAALFHADDAGFEQLREGALRDLAGWQRKIAAAARAVQHAKEPLDALIAEEDEALVDVAGDDALAEFTVIRRALRNLDRIVRCRIQDLEETRA